MALTHKLEKGLAICNGLAMWLVKDEWVIVVPANAVKIRDAEAFCELYTSALGSDPGWSKLEASVWHQLYWLLLSPHVHKICSECDICPQSKVLT